MTLPRIPAVDTVTDTPVVTEFPEWFMNLLVVRATPGGKMNARAKLSPFNYDANVISENLPPIEFEIDLLAESARSPVVAQTMGGVLTSVTLLAQEKVVLEKIAAAEAAEEDTTALEEQLTTIRTNMGITE
jgi:hypothetical protein